MKKINSNRREFLHSVGKGATFISVGAPIPLFWQQAALAQTGPRQETILVVLQLTGGNDGLNTVVPFRDETYRRVRSKLAIPADQVLKINDELGFHPSARGFAQLLESNRLAIVQGTGYAQPNRSHFESMDIWHTCHRKGGSRSSGWLGRCFDKVASTAAVQTPGLHLGGGKQPLALAAEHVRVPSISSPDKFRLQTGNDPLLGSAIRDLAKKPRADEDELLGFLQTSTAAALTASDRIAEALRAYQTPIKYPENELAARFKTVAQLIAGGWESRVYYLELDGFDTHSQQPAAHAALLQQVSGSVQAFLDDLAHHGEADRVLVMCFSEFGRRVAENASEGTDHGAAAPIFLAGSRVKVGLIGEHPSLTDLDDGDLKFHTDFRQVYATVLENWLGWTSAVALGGEFAKIAAIDAT